MVNLQLPSIPKAQMSATGVLKVRFRHIKMSGAGNIHLGNTWGWKGLDFLGFESVLQG